MARSIASATISFGMVSIPVDIYPATQSSGSISFNLLHSTCGSRLKQQYTCIKEGVVVERADMVKGYEFAEGRYVTFTKEELKALEESPTHMIDITEFVPAEAIDPIYYDKAYYLAPGKGGAKPYALLRQAMQEAQRFGLGKWASRGKQYIVELRPVADGIVLQQLLYAGEVRSMSEIVIDKSEVRDAELNLAMRLIEQITSDKFDPVNYQDEEKKRIEAAIQKKIEGEQIAVSADEGQGGAQIIDLMDALRASLEKSGKPAPAEKVAQRKPAKRASEAKPAEEKAPAQQKVPAPQKLKAARK
jgi:DNA end-binding protein Ku